MYNIYIFNIYIHILYIYIIYNIYIYIYIGKFHYICIINIEKQIQKICVAADEGATHKLALSEDRREKFRKLATSVIGILPL